MAPEPGFARLLDGLSSRTDRVWAIGNLAGLGLTLVAAYGLPAHGLFFAYLAVGFRLWLYTLAARRPEGAFFACLLPFGLCAGLVELLADYVLVRGLPSGQLVYLTRDAVLLESPLWMPFAWACVIVEFGYPTVRLYGCLGRDRRAAVAASAAGALLAGTSIGLYEYFAFRAGWWRYQAARVMIGPACAAYIPLGEALMFLAILPLVAYASRQGVDRVRASLLGGAMFGTLILLSYLVAYMVLEIV